MLRIEGLIAVLMKPRNGLAWSPEDRELLRRELRRLARAAPGFVLFLLPGGAILLPLYAWLIDTRRDTRLEFGGSPSAQGQ